MRAIGGAAVNLLEQSLKKLELYDEIDDATGVGNARAALVLTDREQARATRYGSVFSIAHLVIEPQVFAAVRPRVAIRSLRRFLQKLDHEVRTTDGVARLGLDDHEDVIVIMPETGPEGARIFAHRLLASAREELGHLGPDAGNGAVRVAAMTYPGDDDAVRGLRARIESALGHETLRVEEA